MKTCLFKLSLKEFLADQLSIPRTSAATFEPHLHHQKPKYLRNCASSFIEPAERFVQIGLGKKPLSLRMEMFLVV